MELRHLKLVKTVAETKNITKAANLLFLTQSALSHQLRELHDTYNSQIFNRVNKEMVPTRVGERLIEMANNVLNEIEIGNSEIKEILSGNTGVLRLSTHCYTFYHWLSPIVSTYSEKFPNIDIKIVSEATHRTLNFLADGKLDVAIINYKPKNLNFQYHELFEDELILLVSSNHKFANRKYVSPKELVEENYITYALPYGNGVTFDQLFKKNNLYPKKITKVQLTEAVIEMVRSNLGLTVMANWVVESYLRSGNLVKIKINRNGLKRKWYAATLKYKTRPPHIDYFIKSVVDCKVK